MAAESFYHDASGRLTFAVSSMPRDCFPAVCAEVAEIFGLVPNGQLLDGWEFLCWDYRRGTENVGLEWDIWMGFTVVARSKDADALVHEVGSYHAGSFWATS